MEECGVPDSERKVKSVLLHFFGAENKAEAKLPDPGKASKKNRRGTTMASGGFRANAATDFLEEWKAKREKMRAKMLGDIAAATGQCPPPGLQVTGSAGIKPPEPSNNGNSATVNCVAYPVSRSSSSSALRRPEDDPNSRPAETPIKKEPSPPAATACPDSDKESPPHGKGKEKKSSGPSARKGKGQIEKRKLREKRRSTGVVSIPSNEVRSNCFTQLA